MSEACVKQRQESLVNAAVELLADTENWDHMGGWGGGWMWLWSVAMMTLFVVVIVWMLRTNLASSGHNAMGSRGPAERAREILAERYAGGDLTTEEYRERANELQ